MSSIDEALRGSKYEGAAFKLVNTGHPACGGYRAEPNEAMALAEDDAKTNAALAAHAERLAEALESIIGSYEYACFGDVGVEGFRSGVNEEGEDYWPCGEECDADAIGEARATLKHFAKLQAEIEG